MLIPAASAPATPFNPCDSFPLPKTDQLGLPGLLLAGDDKSTRNTAEELNAKAS